MHDTGYFGDDLGNETLTSSIILTWAKPESGISEGQQPKLEYGSSDEEQPLSDQQ